MYDVLSFPLNAPSHLSGSGAVGLLASPHVSRDEAIRILTSREAMLDFFQFNSTAIFSKRMILKDCQPEVLRVRQDSRQVIAYRLIFTDRMGLRQKPLSVVLKRFVNRTKGKNEYLAMRLLQRMGFGEQGRMKVPRPFCYLEEMGLLIQERVAGRLLRSYLGQKTPAALKVMRVAAQWLARLHHLPANDKQIGIHPDDQSSVRVLLDRAKRMDPSRASPMERLAGVIVTRLLSYDPLPLTLVHGDYQGENILLARGNVTVIDFGRFCRSDPARDLGYMIAQAITMAALDHVSPASLVPGLKMFWDAYQASRSPRQQEKLSTRSCAYAGLKFLENITYILAYSQGSAKGIVSVLEKHCRDFAVANRWEEGLQGLSSRS